MAWNRPWPVWAGVLLASMVCVVCFWNALDGDFLFDDKPAIVDNDVSLVS